jgi:hypothetical protein
MGNNSIPAQQHSRSKPVRILSSIAAVCVAAVGVLGTMSSQGVQVPTWLMAGVGAVGILLPIAIGEYTKGQVTPWEDVVEKVTPSGQVIAGPASDQHETGTVVKP